MCYCKLNTIAFIKLILKEKILCSAEMGCFASGVHLIVHMYIDHQAFENIEALSNHNSTPFISLSPAARHNP